MDDITPQSVHPDYIDRDVCPPAWWDTVEEFNEAASPRWNDYASQELPEWTAQLTGDADGA